MINWPGGMQALEVKLWGNPKCQEAEMSPPQKFFEGYISIRKKYSQSCVYASSRGRVSLHQYFNSHLGYLLNLGKNENEHGHSHIGREERRIFCGSKSN